MKSLKYFFFFLILCINLSPCIWFWILGFKRASFLQDAGRGYLLFQNKPKHLASLSVNYTDLVKEQDCGEVLFSYKLYNLLCIGRHILDKGTMDLRLRDALCYHLLIAETFFLYIFSSLWFDSITKKSLGLYIISRE